MATITFDKVNKIYDSGVHAVKDFDLSVKDGEFVVLCGPSGSGKTTALRLIAGLERPSSGNILMDERIVNDMQCKDRGVAMVFQRYALFPHYNVYQNIAIGLRKRLPKTEETKRVREAAGLVGLLEYLERRPNTLSGGQRQRVALARAIVYQPTAYLLDEPLSNLDAKLRTEMRAEIMRLKARLGATFVYVTHDQTEAMTMADRVVVISEGRIMQIGTPKEIYQKPQSKFVARFIGSPAMNMLGTSLKKLNLAQQEVSVGIRAEDIQLQRGAEDQISLMTKIEFIEETGSDSLLYTRQNGEELVVRIRAGHDYKIGDSLEVFLPRESLHIFEEPSGKRLNQ